jgi:dCTP deaminase
MILSNRELYAALDTGRLIIAPEPAPRIPGKGGECPYGTHSVDLRLGNEFTEPQGGPFSYDPSKTGSLAKFFMANSERTVLKAKSQFILSQNSFTLARTLERVSLPLPVDGDVCLAARIEGRSSLARLGLLVHFTAPTVHPGFDGTLTLEMINLGCTDIVLRPGMYIAQLIVEEVRGVPYSNPSQFQGQVSPEGAA